METTMTKIKDLVTVTVDNVFRNFLMDDERYELVEHVEVLHTLVARSDDWSSIEAIKNERIKSFLLTVTETFALHASCLVSVMSAGEGHVSKVTADRARRAKASMCPGDEVYDLTLSRRENMHLYAWCLLSEFRDNLRREHVALAACGSPVRAVQMMRALDLMRPDINGVPSDRKLQS
jgi:hypothetical protein